VFAILLLAAGQGRRFKEAGGSTYKLLTLLHPACTVLRRSCENLLQTGWPVHVITGAHEMEIREALKGLDVAYIPNPDAHAGLGTSIASGVTATADAEGWLIALGDMPFIQPESICCIARAMESGATIAFPTHEGKRGHPVGFSCRFANELMALEGDTGAQKILAENRNAWVSVSVHDGGILRDIDLPRDLPFAF